MFYVTCLMKNLCCRKKKNCTPSKRKAIVEDKENSPCTPTANLKLLTNVATSIKENNSQRNVSKKSLFGAGAKKLFLSFQSTDSDTRQKNVSEELDGLMRLVEGASNGKGASTSSRSNVGINSKRTFSSYCSSVDGDESISSHGLVRLVEGASNGTGASSRSNAGINSKRTFSSYCSSVDGDESISSHGLVRLVEGASNGTGASSRSNAGINSKRTFTSYCSSVDGDESISSPLSENSFVLEQPPAKQMHRQPAMSDPTTEPSNQTTEPSNQTPEPSNQATEPSNQTTEPSNQTPEPSNQTTEPSRRDKSLELLCGRFLEHFPIHHRGAPRKLVVDEMTTSLCTERRRIYDIVNVLESLNMAAKMGKNEYKWTGDLYLRDTLARLKLLGDKLKLPQLMQELASNGTPFHFPVIVPSIEAGCYDSRREKSLGIICQKLLMLLLASPPPRVLTLETAVQVIVSERSLSSSSTASEAESSTTSSHRARGRRMYDIANVLSALGIITRPSGSRSLQYTGPTDLPPVDSALGWSSIFRAVWCCYGVHISILRWDY